MWIKEEGEEGEEEEEMSRTGEEENETDDGQNGNQEKGQKSAEEEDGLGRPSSALLGSTGRAVLTADPLAVVVSCNERHWKKKEERWVSYPNLYNRARRRGGTCHILIAAHYLTVLVSE